MSARRIALVSTVLALGVAVALLGLRGREPVEALPLDGVSESDAGGVRGPLEFSAPSPSIRSPDPERSASSPNSESLAAHHEVPVWSSARGVALERRTLSVWIVGLTALALGRPLRVGDFTEVAADGRIEVTTCVDPRAPRAVPTALWVDGLYADQRSISVPLASDGTMRIELPSLAAGRCRIRMADDLEHSFALVRLDPVGSTIEAHGAVPVIVISGEWVRAHTTARTIGGLVPGTYVVSGAFGEVEFVPSQVVVRANDLSLVTIHRP